MNAAQKQLIDSAMALDGREFAGWAREIILETARSMLDREKRKKARAGTKSDASQQKSRG